jgi:ribonuclease T2
MIRLTGRSETEKMQPRRSLGDFAKCAALLSVLCVSALFSCTAHAQHKGEPGKFDFYLLNLSWAPEFCSIQGTSPECTGAVHYGFIVHGLWPQNNDGTWPVYCADRPGPADPRVNLDITPDLSLLQHEWSKHGTCTMLSPASFFANEHRAFHQVHIPPLFQSLHSPEQMQPSAILDLFATANPAFPRESIEVSCGRNHLTAVEVCLSKQLQPIACQGIHSCRASQITVDPPL